MSGHSKWAGIKHKKAIVDAKRGQAFTRASREITIAAKEGGGDVDGNFRLRLAVQKAREVNMPADKIQAAIDRGTGAGKGDQLEELRYESGGDIDGNFRLRLAVQKAREANMPADKIQAAIDRGTGAGKGESLEELRYEGYGPAGVAIIVDCMTDNRNRTAPAIRHVFSKFGGSLGESNSVAWMFERKGVISAQVGDRDPEEVELAVIEAGAEDTRVDGGAVEITTEPSSFEPVRKAVEAAGLTIENA